MPAYLLPLPISPYVSPAYAEYGRRIYPEGSDTDTSLRSDTQPDTNMTTLLTDRDLILNCFKQRIVRDYGSNLFAALLIGERAHGGASRQTPYDIAVFLRDLCDPIEEYDRLSLVCDDMLAAFDVVFNAYPFASASLTDGNDLVETLRKTGVPFVAPVSEIAFLSTAAQRAEAVLHGKDILCLDMSQRDEQAPCVVCAASVKGTDIRHWAFSWPGDDACEDFEHERSDDAVAASVSSLFDFLTGNILVSNAADALNDLFDKLRRQHRNIRPSIPFSYGMTLIEDGTDYALQLAKRFYPASPESALCQAEFAALAHEPVSLFTADAVQHQALVFRNLLNIV